MFSANKETNSSLHGLFEEAKKYVSLQKENLTLGFLEKLTVILSAALLLIVLLGMGMIAAFYFLFALAYAIADSVGGLPISFSIISLGALLIMLCVYLLRERLIIQPICRFLAKLFLPTSEK
ncbi:MAG: phage holin family protein [Bacteroidaceae bacterium]|nr:phage holin family protein [Bacteroidaceae bacterium]